MGPQPVHRARKHSGWNNPEGVGEAKPKQIIPTKYDRPGRSELSGLVFR